MQQIDLVALKGLDPKLRIEVENVLEEETKEVLLKAETPTLEPGDEKIGDLIFTELAVLTAALKAEKSGRKMVEEGGSQTEAIKATVKNQHALVKFAWGSIYKRLIITTEEYVEFYQDGSIVKPAIPFPKCQGCHKRHPKGGGNSFLSALFGGDVEVVMIRM